MVDGVFLTDRGLLPEITGNAENGGFEKDGDGDYLSDTV